MSPNRRVSCAAASPRTPTTSASRSLARSAARLATSSRSHSVADITGRFIAHATSARGGGRPALTQSRLPAGSGRRRAEWDSGGPNKRHYLGRMTLPHPRTQLQRTRKPAPRQRRKKKPAYWMFPASTTSPAKRADWRNQSSRTRPALRRDHPRMNNGASLARDESSPHGNRAAAQGPIADTAMTGAARRANPRSRRLRDHQ